MILNFLRNATINTFKGFGNTLLNRFTFDISEKDKIHQVGLHFAHFKILSIWKLKEYEVVDKGTKDRYCLDSTKTLRLKCAALFAASLIVQPIGLSLNLLNRMGKIAFFTHLWCPSPEKYHFKARLSEWGKDFFVIISSSLILIGMLFSALYGTILSPYNGRKLYGSFERLAYSGGYQFFEINHSGKSPQQFLLAPCFQPNPKTHLGGGNLGEKNVW